MERRQLSVAFVLAICGAMVVAVPALGVGVDQPAQVENNSTAANGTVGQQVSAFMQTTAVDANATTESGMWQAAVNTSDDPNGTVTSRTAELENRLEAIETQTARLEDRRDRLPEVAYTAQASALNERLAALRAQINETQQTAERVGVNATRLDELRERVGNASGPEVAAVARNISNPGPPPHAGPPVDAGPPDNAGPPGGTNSGPPDDAGPPGEVGPGNDSSPGPSGDAGPGNDTDAGPAENPGPPADAGPPENTTSPENVGPTGDTGPSNDSDGQQRTGGPRGPPGQPGEDGPTVETIETRLVDPV